MQTMLFMNWMEKNFAVKGEVSYFAAIQPWGSRLYKSICKNYFNLNCVISICQTILVLFGCPKNYNCIEKKTYVKTGVLLCVPLDRVTIEHARARSRGRGRGRYSDRFSSRRPRSDRRYVQL